MSFGDRRTASMPASGARRGVSARDAGLDTLARANRWMVAGAVALAGGASAVTWHAFRAHAAGLARAAARAAAPAVVHHHHSDDGGDGESAAPAAPASAPVSAPAPAPAAPAPAVSGGS
jgi:DNA polymerase-3 subunit gamma/tau